MKFPSKIISLTTAVLLAGPSFAQDEGLARCHEVPTADARLTCYDKFTGYSSDGHIDARSVTVVMTDPETPEGKQWRFDSEESALDGRKDVWLSVVSENTQPNQIGQPEKATLWVRCMENSTNMFIAFNDYTTDNQTVQYRLDQDSMGTVWMETVKGGDGIGIWAGSRAITFIKDMFGKQKLVLGYDSYSSNNLEFIFDVSGLRSRIDPLAESCQWRP